MYVFVPCLWPIAVLPVVSRVRCLDALEGFRLCWPGGDGGQREIGAVLGCRWLACQVKDYEGCVSLRGPSGPRYALS